MDALELISVLEKFDVKAAASEAVAKNVEVIADLNATQMNQGVRADGSEILPTYTPLTVFLKKQKGQVTDRVTLRDTGDFQAQLYAEVKGEEIEYGSRDDKAEKLNKKYSKAKGSIFGLNEESREELIDGYLRNDFYEISHEQTGL